ncbi:MAG: diguanylate cyclase [Candidatus Omnitrophota bacterium]
MDAKRATILIADDEPSIREGIRVILLSEGYSVVMAGDGREAVEKFKKSSPDLVILDMKMPRFSGIQALTKIKKFLGERYIPVIFLTASARIDDKLKALGGGAVDYLAKPVSPQELLARIRNFLDIKASHDRLKEASVFDWMTGCLNKEHFLKKASEELAKAVRNKTPLSFIFMDIDNFKDINDSIGHMAGDAVITEFGRRLQKIIRRIDMTGRFGGDEFMVMLPHKGAKDAAVVAERIRKSTAGKCVVFDKKRIRITVSQGVVALDTQKKVSIEALIQKADECLYEAKDKGGACYVIGVME